MTNRFHLAIPAGDLTEAVKFYCNVLGCAKGNSEFKYPDAWVDINFWGNELTLHATDPEKPSHGERHNVDMGNVSVPHFGVHLQEDDFSNLKIRLEKYEIELLEPRECEHRISHENRPRSGLKSLKLLQGAQLRKNQ